MPELTFRVEGARPERVAAVPLLLFPLRVTEVVAPGAEPTPIHAIALRCQVRIEPARRRYTAAEQDRLLDLFGTPERWGQTLRPMPWTHVSEVVRSFTGETIVDLPVPCSYDFSLAATKYFDALEGGEIPLTFLFSGTIFHETAGRLQAVPIPWDREASYRLPASVWRNMMDIYYPKIAWLCLRKDLWDRLERYRSHRALATTELAIERLLRSEERAGSTGD